MEGSHGNSWHCLGRHDSEQPVYGFHPKEPNPGWVRPATGGTIAGRYGNSASPGAWLAWQLLGRHDSEESAVTLAWIYRTVGGWIRTPRRQRLGCSRNTQEDYVIALVSSHLSHLQDGQVKHKRKVKVAQMGWTESRCQHLEEEEH